MMFYPNEGCIGPIGIEGLAGTLGGQGSGLCFCASRA